ncbi:hypothetical protein Ancab_025472 [Ancistrocladus abbreviatus]
MIRNRLQWLNTMVIEPYYLFHFLTFFSYLPIRVSSSLVFCPHINHRLLRREIQAVLAFLVFTTVKMVREETWEAFFANTLLLGKVMKDPIGLIQSMQLNASSRGENKKVPMDSWLAKKTMKQHERMNMVTQNMRTTIVESKRLSNFPGVLKRETCKTRVEEI